MGGAVETGEARLTEVCPDGGDGDKRSEGGLTFKYPFLARRQIRWLVSSLSVTNQRLSQQGWQECVRSPMRNQEHLMEFWAPLGAEVD